MGSEKCDNGDKEERENFQGGTSKRARGLRGKMNVVMEEEAEMMEGRGFKKIGLEIY